jgi:ankyrin repeat protein
MSWERQVEQVTDYLREQGAGPNIFNACFHTDIEAVRRMLRQDPNAARAVDPYGNTTLIWAVRPRERGGKTTELVKLLIDHGADVNRTEKVGWRFAPLHFVCDWWSYNPPERTELAEILLDAGAKINAPAKPGYTPLDLARRRNRAKLAELLESRGGKKGTVVEEE